VNPILSLRYNPCPRKSLREEFNYSSFDDYFSSTFKRREEDSEKETKCSKFVPKFDLMIAAEDYLINLGENLFNLRNYEEDQKVAEPIQKIKKKLNKGGNSKRKRFLKRTKKRRKVKRKESKHISELSSKLLEIENTLDFKAKEGPRKLTQDIVCPINTGFKKRARFRTCQTTSDFQQKLIENISEKEMSIKLDDEKAGYTKSFKNFAFKTYDEAPEQEELKEEKSFLRLSLNPCLPIEQNFRKKSSNSQNVHQNLPLQNVDSHEIADNFCRNPKFEAKSNSNTNIPTSSHDTASCSALKSKDQKFFISSNLSEATRVLSTKKRRKKDRKLSISDNEFNTFYLAFEKHNKTKNEKQMLSPSIPSTGNSGHLSSSTSNISKSKRQKSSKRCKKSGRKKVCSTKKVPSALDGDTKLSKNEKMPQKFSWKMIEIVDSLNEIEKDFD